MVKLTDIMNVDLLSAHIEAGMVNLGVHPDYGDLSILNYSHSCQYAQAWDDVTEQCRGLIYDSRTGEIVARPFRKFYLAEQLSRSDLMWSKPFVVTEKMDGSLGVAYNTVEGVRIATRGSFTSVQAQTANQILAEKYADFVFESGLTPLFEIVYPTNRIVIDYGKTEDLFLLTVIDNETGNDAAYTPNECAKLINWTGPVVRQFDVSCKPRDVLEAVGLVDDGNNEGLVLRFDYPKGKFTRCKTKLDRYKELHYLLTGTSTKTIWTALSNNEDFERMLADVPDEFYDWVRKVERDLRAQFHAIYSLVEKLTSEALMLGTRKKQAEFLLTQHKDISGLVFGMLDNKDISSAIWKLIKPKYEKPFTTDVDS